VNFPLTHVHFNDYRLKVHIRGLPMDRFIRVGEATAAENRGAEKNTKNQKNNKKIEFFLSTGPIFQLAPSCSFQ